MTVKKEKNIETQPQPENIGNTPDNADVAEKPTAKTKPAKVTKVGAMLKEMRLQQGLKLNDIAKYLCIKKEYLDAIEDSNYKNVPPQPYGIGFIRSYANYLGLNGENIVELYKEETNSSEPKDMHVLEPQPEASMPGMQYIVISLLAIVLIYLGWSSFNSEEPQVEEEASEISQSIPSNEADTGVIVVEDFNFEPPAEQDIKPSSEQAEPQEAQIKVVEQSYNETAETATLPADTQDKEPAKEVDSKPQAEALDIPQQGVFVEVLKETWVEVKDDSKLYLSKVLQKGDTYKVPEGKGMILSLGNYDGANVYINGVLTKVARPNKKTNIALDPLLEANR